MAKQLNVNLGFTADTSQAKIKIQELQSQLNSLINNGTKISPLGLDKELSKAISKASELKASLDSAMTPSGTLDLNKFNQSLQANKTKISEYAAELSKLGPAGQQAFATLAQSVNLSSVQLQKSNGLLSQFAVTLKNTAKWQISSSILHGFIGAIRSAYGYAQDLNESLNNIRIVTGASVEDMSKFADQANRAAKALSTTTTAYTDAALIFYQQGLKGNDVTDRADVTIKMANASKQSTEIVSDQLTAIWNNFYDGSESLESYADKITALGAATASSSEEISTGLEKFASVAETVGLSYDYATAALATVTATTRQSADVVGTAFKTLFARLNDLKLGETLDDGTTLGQYTENLAKVGVNIKDVSGQLKDMDIILEETAAKWKELDKDQQVALAKGVAGIRQYNQFIALMSNWDFMKENLKVVEESGGTLQKQADIYSEGWDAASKRVRASAETIYRSLFDDKFFINMTDGFSKVLDTIKGMIDGLGGFKGALSLLSTVLIRVFSKDLSVGIDNFLLKIQHGTQKMASLKKFTESKVTPENSAIGLKREMNKSLANMYDDGTIAGSAQVDIYKQQASLQDVLLDKTQNLLRIGRELSEEEQKQAGIQLDIVRSLGEQAIQAAKNRQESEETTLEFERQAKILLQQNEKNPKTKNYKTKTFDKDIKAAKELQEQYALGSTLVGKLQKEVKNMGNKSPADIEKVITKIKSFIAKADELGIDISKLAPGLKKITDIKITGKGAFDKLEKAISSLDHDLIDLGADAQNTFDKIRQDASNAGIDMSKMGPILDNLQQEFSQTGKFTSEQINLLNSLGIVVDEAGMRFEGFKGKMATMGQSLTAVANTISTTTMLLNSIFGLIDTWNNEDLSFGEKLLNTFTTLGMVLPMVITAFNAQNLAQMSVASSAIAAIFGVKGLGIAMAEDGTLTNIATGATIGFGTALWTVLWPIGLVMAAVAALIAIIYGLVKLFDNLITTENEAKEAAAAHAKEMTEGLNRAKEAASDLKSAFDEYEDVSKTLEECTKGTEAWTEALKANNDKVIELMNKYPQLSTMVNEFGEKAITVDKETGAMKIADWAIADMEAQANQSVVTANAANFQAQRNVREVNLKYQKQDADRKTKNIYTTGSGDYAVTDYNAVQAAKDTVDKYGENATKTQFIEELRSKGNYSEEQLDKLGDKFETVSGDLISLQEAIEENTSATEAENLAITTQLMANNQEVQESGFAEEIAQVTARGYDEDVDKQIKTLKDEGWGTDGISKATGVNDEARNVFARYAEVAGIIDYDLTDTIGADGSRAFVYTDSEGEEITVSLEAMRATVAAAEANKDLQASTEELIKTFDSLKNSSNEADNAMVSFLSQQNFEAASKAEAEAIIGIDDAGNYLNETLGGKDGVLSDEEAQQLGYDSAQSMILAFEEQQENIQKAWNDISLPSNFNSSMGAAADNISLETAQKLEKQIEKMNLGPLGEKAGEDYVNALNSMLGKLDTEDQQKALSELTAINWSDWDAMDQAEQIMKDLGVEIDTSSKEWQEFIENMRLANGAMPDFSQIKADLNQVCAILDKLDFGSIISEEDYARLVAYNDEWERFFMLQADGTRKFIGNATDMKQETRDSINEQRKELEYRKEIQEGMDNAGWSVNGEKVDWYKSGDQFSYTDSAQNLINAGGDTEKVLEELGYTDDVIQEIIDDYNKAVESGDEEAIKKAEERFKTMYNGIGDFMGEDLDIVDAELDEMMASTATSFAELNQLFNEGLIGESKFDSADELTAYEKGVQNLAINGVQAAQSLSELESVWSQALSTGVELDYGIYSENLLRLAENYSICADEAHEFEIALQSGNDTAIKAAEENLEASIILGEATEKYDLNADELSVQAQQLRKEYELTAKEAANLTIQNQRMNKGVSSMVDNWQEWRKELKKTDKTSQDWAKAAAACTKAIADLIGASEDLELPDDFFDEGIGNMELLDKAAQGDIKAINLLGIAVAEAQVSMMSFVQGMKVFGEDGTLIDLNEEGFNSAVEQVKAGLTSLQDQINTLGLKPGTDVYSLLGGEDWVTSLNQLAAATQMTKEEMNNLLNEIGVQAEVEVKSQKQEMEVPTYTEVVEKDDGIDTNDDGEPDAHGYHRYTIPGEPKKVTGYVQVAQIKATGNDGISSPEVKFTGNGNVSNSAKQGSSSGKSSSKAKDSHKKKSDVTDRYKEINDSLEKTNRLMEKNSTLVEGIWGSKKIQAMKQNINLMKQENDLLEDKLELANKYLAEDRAELEATGVGFTFEDEYITNYTEIMDGLFAGYDAKWNEFSGGNKDAELSEEQQEILDKMWEHIETVKTAYEKYEGTLDEVQDLQQEQIEKDLAIQQENYNILNEELEIKLSINEDDLSVIEYYLNKMSDDFYSMAEAAALMVGDTSKKFGEGGGQLGNYLSNLALQESQYNTLRENFETIDPKTGKTYINQQQYIEGLRGSRDALIDNLNSLNELDKTMLNYYSDTLAAAGEELSKYTTRMEHQTSVLEYYSSVMEIMGKQQDYESMKVILEAQAQTIEDQMEVAKANYEMLAEQEKLRREAYDEAIARGASEEELEVYKNNWEAAADAANEAQEEMFSKTEAWAEAMKAVVENKLSGLAKSLENALTGEFGSFDALFTQMEHAVSLQEEYLTTTNKIYETNKMMRTAQQEIDKSTNSVAKKKLKNFINETEQLQNQTKLSQYELEIQQAKYDLLLAEIALEEAQGAKSTVRLQRDSEGNFGYVYTADQNEIAEAEQKFADAQNSLYNIGLEGANNYTEKYQQTLQEFYDTMTELQTQYLNGEFENEQEYQDKMAEAKDFYYKKLQEYSELYTIAIGTDARVIQDAWSTEFQTMVNGTEEWKIAVDGYVDEVNLAFEGWEKVVDRLAEQTVGKDLTTLKTKTSDITNASKDLKTELIGTDGKSGLVKGFGDVANAVANTTGQYAAMREEINRLITEYEKLLGTINKDIQNENNGQSIGGTKTGDSTTSTNTSDNTSNSTNSTPKTITAGANVKASSSAQIYDYAGDTSGEYQYYANDPNYVVMSQNGEWVLVRHHTQSAAAGWFKKSDLTAFDTGGYTGDWGGSYGKLAMLHQKELVLKEGDTENFLASMELLDNIVKTIDLYSANAQWGGILSSPTFGNYNGQEPIEQNVYIEANFPEATDRNEIIEAINTLSNQASQLVNRK